MDEKVAPLQPFHPYSLPMKNNTNSKQEPFSEGHLLLGGLSAALSSGLPGRTPSFSNFSDWAYVGSGMVLSTGYSGGQLAPLGASCWYTGGAASSGGVDTSLTAI